MESNLDKGAETASSTTASPDELIKDLDVSLSKDEENSVVAGKSGKLQHEYMIIKLTDVIITSVNPGGK